MRQDGRDPQDSSNDTHGTSANPAASLSRRLFLQAGTFAGAGAALTSWPAQAAENDDSQFSGSGSLDQQGPEEELAGATIAELQARMTSGLLSARRLADLYLRRITRIDTGLDLRSVLQINPDARRIAAQLDEERRRTGPRGPLHGIPILLKDNIDTGDRMQTTAGSKALQGAPAAQDATVAQRLREAGAVILGKTNLSEWANFRGLRSPSGWSGVQGLCRNPHILDRSPSGSSAGSAAAVAAALACAALGSETDGSIVGPAGQCGVAGIKPTVGLTSRAGVVPISFTQDTIGVHGRTVADAATVLSALTRVDPRDEKTAASAGRFSTDYRQFLDSNGLAGARIGVLRQFTGVTTETDAVFDSAIEVMRNAGAIVVDPVLIPSFNAFNSDPSETIVLIVEFRRALNAYLAGRAGAAVRSLAQVIQFNREHAAQELEYFGQELLELSEAGVFSEAQYREALLRGPMLAGAQGIDMALGMHGLDALVAPTNPPAWPADLVNGDPALFGSSSFAAVTGYPLVTVTGGYVFDLPLGITFMASAWSEPRLIRLASGFEAAAGVRRRPQFLRTLRTHRHDAAVDFAPADSHLAIQPARQISRDSLVDALLVPRMRRFANL